MNSAELIRLAVEEVKPGVLVDVWEDLDFPTVVLCVTITERGELTTYLNDHYDEEIEAARLK